MWIVNCFMYYGDSKHFIMGVAVGPFTSKVDAEKACISLNEKYLDHYWKFQVTEIVQHKDFH